MSGLPRFLLEKYFGREPRLLRAFADQSIVVEETQKAAGQTTAVIRDASFVTLGPNDELTNERVLVQGAGISLTEDGGTLVIALSNEAPVVSGGFQVTFYATSETNVQLPPNGLLATQAGSESLSNKVLVSPGIGGISDYADDVAAATGGVPVGGVYRTGSALKVRVA